MDTRIIFIPITLIAISVVALWYAISAKGPWWLKLALIIGIPAAGLYVVRQLPSYQGYPTTQALPTKGILLAYDVREPNRASRDQGAIQLWVRPLKTKKRKGTSVLEYDPKTEPRAYRLPYSRDMHERLKAADETLRQGKFVMITNGDDGEPGTGKGRGVPIQGASGHRGHEGPGGYYGRPEEGTIEFYKMPEVQLPEKDPTQ